MADKTECVETMGLVGCATVYCSPPAAAAKLAADKPFDGMG